MRLHEAQTAIGADSCWLADLRTSYLRVSTYFEIESEIAQDAENYHAIAIDFATERTIWRNSSATGLRVRFLKVKIATGRV